MSDNTISAVILQFKNERLVFYMAFESLAGERIYVSQSAQTFLVGDYFSVYEMEDEIPMIYEWDDVKSYSELNNGVTITVTDGDTYHIPRNAFSDNLQLIRFRAIAEGQLGSANCRLTQRILPPKYNYRSVDPPEQSFSANCRYYEKDINSGSIANMHSKAGKYIIATGIVIFIAVFIVFVYFRGELAENWFYYLPISAFCGIAAGAAVYLVSCVVARLKFADYIKHDVSALEEIIIVVAHAGFAAVEQSVYTGMELIPWSAAEYYFETKTTLVIVCKDKSACWIPKRVFPKNVQNDISSFVASRVQAK